MTSLYVVSELTPFTSGDAREVNTEFFKISSAIDQLNALIENVNAGTGTAKYMWVAYADSLDGTANFTTGLPESRQFMGVAFNKSTITPSTNPSDYLWLRIFGATNDVMLKSGGTMTGQILVDNGTAGAPGLAGEGDPNTGVYLPGSGRAGIVTDGFVRMYVDASGFTHVRGEAANDGGASTIAASGNLRVEAATSGPADYAISTFGYTDHIALQFVRDISGVATQIGTITVTDFGVTYGSISDYRVKRNIQPIVGALDRLKLLTPCRFNMVAHPDVNLDGFIAHEVAEVVPEAVDGSKDAVDEDGNPNLQTLDQSRLVPLLTAAMQELVARVEMLETKYEAWD